jgi:membrane protease subunit HflK
MAEPHHHHHHHGDLPLDVIDEPLDPANQSLADALRLSFRLLKLLMITLVVLFFGSGFFTVGPEEKAVVLRFGQIAGDKSNQVKEPGYHFAFPPPIDEQIIVSTKYRTLEIDTFYFQKSAADAMRTLDEMGGRYLKPGVDGAMITGDAFMVHVLWKVQYQISDLVQYVSHLYNGPKDDDREKAIVQSVLENALVASFAQEKAEDIIVGGPKLDTAIKRTQDKMQQELSRLKTGLTVSWVTYSETPTPPLLVRHAFNAVISSENNKLKTIETARKEASDMLIAAGGRNYDLLAARIDEIEKSRSQDNDTQTAELEAKLRDDFVQLADGQAKSRYNEAISYYSRIKQSITSDKEQFDKLLPEYRRNPNIVLRQQHFAVVPEILARNKKFIWSRNYPVIIETPYPPKWAREDVTRQLAEEKKK